MTEALVHPDWVRRLNLFGDVVGDPRLLASLDPAELLATARASTGLDDLGEDDWPGWTETYRRMVTAIDHESQLHALGRVVTRAEILKVLQTWLRLQRVWTARPAIRTEPIEAPLFVVGPPRTGTKAWNRTALRIVHGATTMTTTPSAVAILAIRSRDASPRSSTPSGTATTTPRRAPSARVSVAKPIAAPSATKRAGFGSSYAR